MSFFSPPLTFPVYTPPSKYHTLSYVCLRFCFYSTESGISWAKPLPARGFKAFFIPPVVSFGPATFPGFLFKTPAASCCNYFPIFKHSGSICVVPQLVRFAGVFCNFSDSIRSFFFLCFRIGAYRVRVPARACRFLHPPRGYPCLTSPKASAVLFFFCAFFPVGFEEILKSLHVLLPFDGLFFCSFLWAFTAPYSHDFSFY